VCASLLGATLLVLPGCIDSDSLQAFRDAASSSLQTGLKAIFDGLIEGAFAALQPEASQSSSSSSTSSSSSSTSSSGSSTTGQSSP